jgi:hypothetical protein
LPWTRKFSEHIALDDGRILATLRDAAEFALGLPKPRLQEPYWQCAAEALMKAAEPDSNVNELRDVERLLKAALKAEGVLS